MRHDDDTFSDFRSAIEWPWMRPPAPEAAGNFKSLSELFPPVLELLSTSYIIAPECDSPIEIELGARLRNAFACVKNSGLVLVPQFKLGPFRYDFAIIKDEKPIALIECDGRDYHSTAAQVANDRKKDALAAKNGAMLFRFSGSEIFCDGKNCVLEILKHLYWRDHLTLQQWEAIEAAIPLRSHYRGDNE